MASNYQFNRIETIYPTRDEAIEKLGSLSLPFGTGVVVRYLERKSHECGCSHRDPFAADDKPYLIAAIYVTEEPGNYSIISDGKIDIENLLEGGLKVYQGTIGNDQSAEEAIKATLFGIDPEENNIVILLNKTEGVSESYIYIDKKWVCLGKEQAPIQFSSQFSFDKETRDLSIKQIHGGTF